MANDGTIRVGTALDLSGIRKDMKELEKEIGKAEKEIDRVEKEKVTATKDDEKIIEKGGPEAEAAIERQIEAVEALVKKQEELEAQIARNKELLKEATAEYERQSALAAANGQLNSAIADDKFANSITSQEEYNTILEETLAKMAMIEAEAARIAEATGVNKEELLSVNAEYQKLSNIQRILTERTFEFGEAGAEAGRKVKSSLKSTTATADALTKSVNKGLGMFKKLAFAVIGARSAYMLLRQAVNTYLSQNEELKSQVEALKNTFATALGPAIEWIINLLVKAVTWVSAFINALTGINLIAKANAAAIKKQGEAASAAAKAQSAAFDEQNKLTDTSGGGSSSSAATLPDGSSIDLSFFDPLIESVKEFWAEIQPFIDTVKEFGLWLWDNVLVPVADWFANSVIPAILDVISGLLLAINEALLYLSPVLEFLWENVIKPFAETFGEAIVTILSAVANWLKENKEPIGAFLAIVVELGIAILAIVNIVTTIIVLIGALWQDCEGFRDGIKEMWEGIKTFFQGLWEWIKWVFGYGGDELLESAKTKMREGGKQIWEGLLNGLKAGWEWIKEKAKEIWNKIVEQFKTLFGIHSPSTLFEGFGSMMMQGLINGIKNAMSRVVQACKDIWSAIKNVFASVGDWFKDKFTTAWTNVKNVFTTGSKIFDGIKEGIENTFKTIVNKLISGINTIIAFPFNKINSLLNNIRSIKVLGIQPFVNLWGYNPLSVPQIPQLARGGIVNNPGKGVPAIIGEAGAEAVLPLQNHTEWMDVLADKINGAERNVTIQVVLSGKKIYEEIVNLGNKRNFATNGG